MASFTLHVHFEPVDACFGRSGRGRWLLFQAGAPQTPRGMTRAGCVQVPLHHHISHLLTRPLHLFFLYLEARKGGFCEAALHVFFEIGQVTDLDLLSQPSSRVDVPTLLRKNCGSRLLYSLLEPQFNHCHIYVSTWFKTAMLLSEDKNTYTMYNRKHCTALVWKNCG